MSLKLYFDLMSQPSRALVIFFNLNKIPYEACPVQLRKGEHFSADFGAKLNRFQKVPFIHHDNFKLSESVAIVRYVSKIHQINNNWYSQDAEEQARIDEFLEWQHNNTRAFCALYFRTKWLMPIVTGEPAKPERVAALENNMNEVLDTVENVWLAKTPFLCGDHITVADIFGACEIEQPRIAGFEPREGRPVLKAWLDRVRKETNPYYDEAHSVLYKLAGKSGQAKL